MVANGMFIDGSLCHSREMGAEVDALYDLGIAERRAREEDDETAESLAEARERVRRRSRTSHQPVIWSIAALFRLRHDLVHPKGKRVEMNPEGDLMDPRFERFNPEAAANFIIRVADAAATLCDQDEDKAPDRVIVTVLENRHKLATFGEVLREELPQRPKTYNLGKSSGKKEREEDAEGTGAAGPGASGCPA